MVRWTTTQSKAAGPDGLLTEKEIKEILKEHDVNHDGLLSKEELKSAFKKLGSRCPRFRVHDGVHHADTNGDGFIGDDELNGLVKYVSNLGYTLK